jgi:hypothetical protein
MREHRERDVDASDSDRLHNHPNLVTVNAGGSHLGGAESQQSMGMEGGGPQESNSNSNAGLVLDPCWLNEDFHWLSNVNFNDAGLEGGFLDFDAGLGR